MRKTISAAALLLVLVCSAHAGEIQNGIAPPDSTTKAIQEQPTDGDMPNGGEMPNGYIPNGAADGMTQITLDLLTLLPPLF